MREVTVLNYSMVIQLLAWPSILFAACLVHSSIDHNNVELGMLLDRIHDERMADTVKMMVRMNHAQTYMASACVNWPLSSPVSLSV